MLASTTGQTRDYILKRERDKPPEEQTRFQLRMLKARARMKVFDELVAVDDRGEPAPRAGSGMYAACRFGVAGWSNLRDSAGREVPCLRQSVGSFEVLTDASLDAIADDLFELGAEVMRLNKLDEGTPADEKKR